MRQCPKHDTIKEGSLQCEECDHWKTVRIIYPKQDTIPVSVPFAVQRCNLLPSRDSDSGRKE